MSSSNEKVIAAVSSSPPPTLHKVIIVFFRNQIHVGAPWKNVCEKTDLLFYEEELRFFFIYVLVLSS